MRSISIAMAVICTLSACGGKKERKARATLPPGGKYAEVLLTSTWFSGPALIGPVGGPTQGYELTLEVWPEGPTLALAGEIGKDELDGDPMFRALKRPSLEVKPDADGHAVAWTIDGDTWHAVYLDGPGAFSCPHEDVKPGAVPPTREVVERILTGAGHPLLPSMTSFRGSMSEPTDELKGALEWSVRKAPRLAETWFAAGHSALLERDDLDLEDDSRAEPDFEQAETDTGCLVAADTSPLPAELTEAFVLSRLEVPEKVDEKTCAAWKAFDTQLEKQVATMKRPAAAGPSPDAGRPVFYPRLCVAQVNAMAVTHLNVSARGLFGPSNKQVKAYVTKLNRCGHVDQRDEKCEASLLANTQAEWTRKLERQRRSGCAAHHLLLDQVRGCLDASRVGPQDGAAAGEVLGSWQLLAAVASSSRPLFCPTKLPEWPVWLKQH